PAIRSPKSAARGAHRDRRWRRRPSPPTTASVGGAHGARRRLPSAAPTVACDSQPTTTTPPRPTAPPPTAPAPAAAPRPEMITLGRSVPTYPAVRAGLGGDSPAQRDHFLPGRVAPGGQLVDAEDGEAGGGVEQLGVGGVLGDPVDEPADLPAPFGQVRAEDRWLVGVGDLGGGERLDPPAPPQLAATGGPHVAHPLRVAPRGDQVARAVDGQRVDGHGAPLATRASPHREHPRAGEAHSVLGEPTDEAVEHRVETGRSDVPLFAARHDHQPTSGRRSARSRSGTATPRRGVAGDGGRPRERYAR